MKITDIEVVPIAIPIRRTHKIASFTLNAGYFGIVTIHTDDGLVGFGEAQLSMGPVFPEETLAGAVALIGQTFRPLLIGRDPFDTESLLVAMDRAATRNYTAKTAVEFALFDLMGKALNTPAYRLLGGAYRLTIPLSWSLGIGQAEEEVAEAREKIAQGFRIFKIKFGFLSPSQDLYRLEAIRDGVGPDIDLRVDVNQGWTADVAIPAIRALERRGLVVTLIEQPVPGWDVNGLARIAHAVDTPIMADESLFSLSDACRLIDLEAADIFALKVMKHGGLRRTKQIAAIAASAGIPCYVGSNLETGLGTQACLHFAVSTEIVRYGCELFGPLLLSDDIVAEPVEYADGVLRAPTGAGLGATLDPQQVARYRQT